MKYCKRVLSFVIVAVLMFSTFAIPASAASDTWVARFQRFPTLNTGTSNYAYVKALQTFLLVFGGEAKTLIIEGGGVDGSYGTKTKEAVKVFQEERFPYDSNQWDGVTGSGTWGMVAAWLDHVWISSTVSFFCGYGENVYRAVQTGTTQFSYYYQSAAGGWLVFRQE